MRSPLSIGYFGAMAFGWLLAAGCSGTTGSQLVTFTARAGGPAGIATGQPLPFTSGMGYQVTLSMTRFHLGAFYLNTTTPTAGLPEQSCVQTGSGGIDYVGQDFGGCDQASGICGVDLDLLSPELVTLPIPGQGSANPVVQAAVWLTGGDINDSTSPAAATPILQVTGTAVKNGQSWPFSATVTIGKNRLLPVQNQATPGSNPICTQRIVSPICGSTNCMGPMFTLSSSGTLDLRIDPRGMFDSTDFSTLSASGMPPVYVIPDGPGGAGDALFAGVRSRDVYQFTWMDAAQ